CEASNSSLLDFFFFRARGSIWSSAIAGSIGWSGYESSSLSIRWRNSSPRTAPPEFVKTWQNTSTGRAKPRMFGRRKPTSRATLIQIPHLPRVARVRGVAWSILGGSGPLDSGSNPDGPIHQVSRRSLIGSESIERSETNRGIRPTVRPFGATSMLCGVDGNVAHHAAASIRDGPEWHRSRTEEKHEESRRASSGQVVAVG